MGLFEKFRKIKQEKQEKARKQDLLEKIKSHRDILYGMLGLNGRGEPVSRAKPIETWTKEQREFGIYRHLLAIEDVGISLGRVSDYFRRYDFFEIEYSKYKRKIKEERSQMRG